VLGEPHQQDGAEQQREEELEVAHAAGSLVFRALLPLEIDSEDHIAGPYDAPLTLVMYGDFQCPYCNAAQSIVRRVRERLDGRLRFIFRHLPLPEVHPDAERAAEAAEAAAAQGSFWEMHDALYANGGRLAFDEIVAVADRIGLDTERFRADLESGAFAARVARDAEPARAHGVTATPAFFVNGVHHTDAFDARSLVEALTSDPAGAD
jgi:protein-disulfide isomerase